MKRARREESRKNKGKGKKKVTAGASEKVVDSAQNPPSATFIGEDISAEEARLIDTAIASSVATNQVESMLRTQSAGAGPSNLGERCRTRNGSISGVYGSHSDSFLLHVASYGHVPLAAHLTYFVLHCAASVAPTPTPTALRLVFPRLMLQRIRLLLNQHPRAGSPA